MPWYTPLLSPPRLDWLQVEISTCCNASCLYCPRTIYSSGWQSRHMPLELFRRLKSTLKKTDLVFLQGWGEPFTHPDFFEFVRFAQSTGCRVGTTSNGQILSESFCRRIVEAPLDILALSLAGCGQDNDRVRRGTSLEHVSNVLDMLRRIKKEVGTDRPALHIAYLLLRSRLADLEELPSFFAGLGVDQVVISSLDLVAARDLETEALVPQNEGEYAELRSRLDAAIAAAGKLGVSMHAWLARPEHHFKETAPAHPRQPAGQPVQSSACTENIDNAAVIGVDGNVSPCVYARLPIEGSVHHWVSGNDRPFTPLVFGNIQQASFAQIWRSRAYASFRQSHHHNQPPLPCRECIRRRM